ncbi:uncharacterized protein KY384_008442 [Bacidia gigantensis]|uniref:uncharacterized protein n=1 Tax=Bacidia gigantensis TaxID=2732470 RepID=UPI001D0384E2|nr:uncharacterized protein KY384_008442 [Bacidia gigantensis]KAG8527013.1 hypothetical protein KY384_008442 [Bacidia gigantensis]
MDGLLNPVSTKDTRKAQSLDITPALPSTFPEPAPTAPSSIPSLETALQTLTSQPTQSRLASTLKYLSTTISARSIPGSNILLPSPKTAPIVFALVNHVVPNFWPALKNASDATTRKVRDGLFACLRSISGGGAILALLRGEIDAFKAGGKGKADTQKAEVILDFLEGLLHDDELLAQLWRDVHTFETQPVRADMLWKEVVKLFAGGTFVSVVAEMESVLREKAEGIREPTWISDGRRYAEWLGTNVQHMIEVVDVEDQKALKDVQQVLSKTFTLGHSVQVVAKAFHPLLSGDEASLPRIRVVLREFQSYDQKLALYSSIQSLSTQSLRDDERLIGAVGALVSKLCGNVIELQHHLGTWLVGSSPEAIKHSHITHRAIVLALSVKIMHLKSALWKALDSYSDKLFIKHSPLLHQEANVQILLLLAGQIHRTDKKFLSTVSKSSPYLSGISNHLAASSPKARFLGMVFGSSISNIVDESGKRLDFKSEDSSSAEWRWYMGLINLQDSMGSISDLKFTAEKPRTNQAKNISRPVSTVGLPSRPSKIGQSTKVLKIEEVEDVSESDDDLPIYGKPDSDPEDDDDDPELVQRNKPIAPVYIRDLSSGLRDTENYDRHTLALNQAPNLIRRKIGFGTEVSDHIEDLASTIVGLKDRWELDNFAKLRLEAMLATVLADPIRMGKWFAQSFYNGDYSLSQRVSILTALGLGAREIAGMRNSENAFASTTPSPDNTFPSKRLPSKLHNHYALDAAPLDALSTQISRTMIQPLAATAADAITGPNILKVRTFSSRMEVEKKRSRPTSNALAKIVADSFFFPLTGRWQVHTHAFGDNAPQASPMLLAHLLKTLSLILHAAGPATVALPQITSEFWAFLLSIRAKVDDKSVLEALLFALLTLLDVNQESGQRRVAEENARELLETQGWVGELLERMSGGGEEEERCRMLAAGVLVRCREVVEKHQRLMVGDMIDYS